jgi:hypothetical protein
MRRTVTRNQGYLPDYTFTSRRLKKRLGITDRERVNWIKFRGDEVSVILSGRKTGRAQWDSATYTLRTAEFAEKLGISGTPYFADVAWGVTNWLCIRISVCR